MSEFDYSNCNNYKWLDDAISGLANSDKNTPAPAATNIHDDKPTQTKNTSNTTNPIANTTNPIANKSGSAFEKELDEHTNQDTGEVFFPSEADYFKSLDTDGDGQAEKEEIQDAKQAFKERGIDEIKIGKEEVDIIHEEDVEEKVIETQQTSIVFRDLDETTEDKEIDNTNPEEEDGEDDVLILDGSEGAENTVQTMGGNFFASAESYNVYYDSNDSSKAEDTSTEELKLALKTANFTYVDANEEKVKGLSPFELEIIEKSLDLYLEKKQWKKEDVSIDRLNAIRNHLIKLKRKSA